MIRDSFNPDIFLTVHWDGKMLPDLIGKKVDRLAIIVSGYNTMKLLGAPKLLAGTGEAQASAVFNLLEEWQISHLVQAICFDTTASNTGIKAGACGILQDKLNKPVLHLACRHHVLELLVAKVFSAVLEQTTTSPEIIFFKNFRSSWDNIDCNFFQSGISDESVAAYFNLAEIKQLSKFLTSQ